MVRHIASALTIVFLSFVAADAQSAAPPPAGPLTLEPIHSPLTVSAQYKVTDLDGDVGHMAGVRAGRLVDDFLFIGGAVNWLPDGRNRAELTYGGAVVGWSSSSRRRIRFGGEGLLGAGTAQLPTDLTVGQRGIDPRHFGRTVFIAGSDGTRTIRTLVRDDFFVFEPQANLDTRVTNHLSVDLSAGYRIVGLDNALRNRLDGVTGSLGVRFTF